MNRTFRTMQDAMDAGFRRPVPGVDRDVSGPGRFGYTYVSPEGERTVSVWLERGVNRIGQTGSVAVLFPPQTNVA